MTQLPPGRYERLIDQQLREGPSPDESDLLDLAQEELLAVARLRRRSAGGVLREEWVLCA